MQSPTIPIPGVSEVDFAVDDSSHDVLLVTSCSIGDVIVAYSSCSYKFLQIFFKNVLCLSKYFLLKFESNVCVLSFYSCVSGLCRLRRNDRLSCCSLPRLCSASSVNSAATTLAYNHSHTHTNKTRRAKCRLARLRSCCCEPRSLLAFAEKIGSSKTRRSTTRKQTSKIK